MIFREESVNIAELTKDMLPETTSFLGYEIFTGKKEFFSSGVKGVVNTLNPHSYILARKDPAFSKALKASAWLLPDGVGIKIAARILAGKRIERIAGSDLHEVLIASLGRTGGSCFYLGSSEETLAEIKKRLAAEHPGIKAGMLSPPFMEVFGEKETSAMIDAVNSFSPDVLFVGMTAPKQEKWVFDNKERLNAPLICCIGAVFDFYAGTVRRPGKFWIRMGLEWLPRLIREPRRLWKRNFISTPLFLWHIMTEKAKMLFTFLKNRQDHD
jgi:N-acetylglucosaminyldiphosphoundecaprenol N-acetyl-beta-D-mannosaminyltransferase